jgi:decaprenyl-phosphate phosphoribosyltransferase
MGGAASGLLTNTSAVMQLITATISFCFISSAIYAFNDVIDKSIDANHPKKKKRPIASGFISANQGFGISFILGVFGLILAFSVNITVFIIEVIYVCIQILYGLKTKNVIVLDVLSVASGFVLRGLVGVFAVNASPSVWFNLLAMFGSLLLVSGKRFAEKGAEIESQQLVRIAVSRYSISYLTFLREFSAGGLLMSYALMISSKVQDSSNEVSHLVLQLSVIPFLISVLLIVWYQDRGEGEEPDRLIAKNSGLLLAGSSWALLFFYFVYRS